MARRRFVVVCEDYAGLGWAIRLNQDGDDVTLVTQPSIDEEDLAGHDLIGTGIVPKVDLETAIADKSLKDAYWLFEANRHSDVSERLRRKGYNVFGASALSAKLELDRAYGVSVAQSVGLDIPETVEFTTIKDGLSFLDEHLDLAYVFKPNASSESWRTFVPNRQDDVASNRQLSGYLEHLDSGAIADGFILQERKKGVEVNFELFMYQGQPFFALCDLGTKRKLNRDKGEHCGCSSDVVFQIPITCQGITQTVGRFETFYHKNKYTGFADVNAIISDRNVWFLEFCARFGYSSHPNLFMTCAIDPFGDLMADWIDGKIDGFAKRFRQGFGASVNLYLDHPQRGIPLWIDPKAERSFYAYDCYRDDEGELLLAGYSTDVGVYAQHAYTMEDAAATVLQGLDREAVAFAELGVRTDLDQRGYPSSPLSRYDALVAMGAL